MNNEFVGIQETVTFIKSNLLTKYIFFKFIIIIQVHKFISLCFPLNYNFLEN